MKSIATTIFSPNRESSESEGSGAPNRSAVSTGGHQAAVSAEYYPEAYGYQSAVVMTK